MCKSQHRLVPFCNNYCLKIQCPFLWLVPFLWNLSNNRLAARLNQKDFRVKYRYIFFGVFFQNSYGYIRKQHPGAHMRGMEVSIARVAFLNAPLVEYHSFKAHWANLESKCLIRLTVVDWIEVYKR